MQEMCFITYYRSYITIINHCGNDMFILNTPGVTDEYFNCASLSRLKYFNFYTKEISFRANLLHEGERIRVNTARHYHLYYFKSTHIKDYVLKRFVRRFVKAAVIVWVKLNDFSLDSNSWPRPSTTSNINYKSSRAAKRFHNCTVRNCHNGNVRTHNRCLTIDMQQNHFSSIDFFRTDQFG